MPVLIMLGIALLGVVGKNQTVTIAMLVLALLRLSGATRAFPFLERNGVTLGVIILTIAVMAPIASGRIGLPELTGTFTEWRSIMAILVGVLVAYLGGRGVRLMADQPLVVNGLLIGTIIGVAVFRGVPVGPLIAAGILSLVIGKG